MELMQNTFFHFLHGRKQRFPIGFPQPLKQRNEIESKHKSTEIMMHINIRVIKLCKD